MSMQLASYLTKRHIHPADFAKQIGVSGEAVRRYLVEGRIPTPAVMTRILEVTQGKVTANDFYSARTKAEELHASR
jgi:predicted transcriptional regulator